MAFDCTTAYREIKCHKCKKTWEEVFEMVGLKKNGEEA